MYACADITHALAGWDSASRLSHVSSFAVGMRLLLVNDIGGDLVETDLLGDSLSSGSVFSTSVIVEYPVDLLEGKTLGLHNSSEYDEVDANYDD